MGFILAAGGLAVVASFLKDSRGVPYGATLSLIWLYVAGVTFTLGVIYFGQFAAPIRGRYGWWEGVRLIMRAYAGSAQQFMRQSRTGDRKKRQRTGAILPPTDIPRSLYTLRAGNIRSYQVLALTKGNGYVRPTGPGFVTLYHKEDIRSVIDLRVQMRQQPVHVNTRDGIPVGTTLTAIFQVNQDRAANPQLLFPFDSKAIFHLSYLHTVNVEGKAYGWTEQLTPRAAALLTAEMTQFNLDALIHYPTTAVSPLDEITRRIHQMLKGEFNAKGVNVIAIKAGPLQLPKEVQEQNIANWRAEWQRKIKIEEATGQAEEIRRKKQARARAQVEIIQTIIQNLETMRQGGESDLYQVIVLRLIDALEEAVAADSPRMFVPQQIMASLLADASAQVRARLDDSLLPSGQQNDTEEA